MDPAILQRHSFAQLNDNIKPHQNIDKLCGVIGIMKAPRQYMKNGQNKEVLEGTLVDYKLDKIVRLSVYAPELFKKFETNKGILLANVMFKNGEIIVTKKSQANTLMKMKLTKEQEERCNTMLNSGFERHTKISELQVGTLVTLQGIVTKVIDKQIIVKTSKELMPVKELTLDDDTGATTVKLWDQHSNANKNITTGTKVTITCVRVKTYDGKVECNSSLYTRVTIEPKSVVCNIIGVEDQHDELVFTAEIEDDYVSINAQKRVLPARYKSDASTLAELLPFKLNCLLEGSNIVSATECVDVIKDELFEEDNYE